LGNGAFPLRGPVNTMWKKYHISLGHQAWNILTGTVAVFTPEALHIVQPKVSPRSGRHLGWLRSNLNPERV
jgi:hypothetical protein